MSAEQSLPTSWIECTLGDVVNYGATQKAEPSEIPSSAWVLELEDIERDSSKLLQRLTFAERQSKSTKSRFNSGDVLYGKLRPYLNKVIRADDAGYCTTEIVPLTPPAELDGGYLFHWLKHPRFLEYVTSVSHGLNMPRLGTDAGRKAPFVLAPLPEQKRIADKLDRLLAQTRACRERLDRLSDIFNRFRKSVLNAATSGRLTEEWREDNAITLDVRSLEFQGDSVTIPEYWRDCLLTELIDPKRPLCYGVVQPGDSTPDGTPLIRVQDIDGGTVDVFGLRTISAEVDDQYRRSRVKPGDLLVSVVGTIGRTAIVPEGVEANIARAVARISCIDGTTSRWVGLWLASDPLQWWMLRSSREVARKTLNLSELGATRIAVPPIEEQKEIIRRVESLFALLGRLENCHEAACSKIELLTPAMLAKAFRGEFVSQDPNDGSVEDLLVKIKARRSTAVVGTARRPRTTRRKQADMGDTGKNAIKTAILSLKTATFSFDDLLSLVPEDYDSLKSALFELLDEPKPIIRQVFDKKAEAIHFERVTA